MKNRRPKKTRDPVTSRPPTAPRAIITRTLVVTILLLLAGCSRGPATVEVSGTVAFDGQPIERGQVSFVPTGGSDAPDGGPITDGRFRCRVKPGKKIVQIRASRPLPAEQQDQPEMGLLYEDYLPAKYHRESTLSVNIAKSGDNEFTFALSSE